MGLILSIFASDILPIFAIAGAGYALARLAGADARTLVRVVFYALLPCLAFRMVVTAERTGPEMVKMVWMAALVMGAMGVIGFLAGKLIGLKGVDLRAFLMVVMFSNGGNYGLPVVRFAFGEETLGFATAFFLAGSVFTYIGAAFFAGGRGMQGGFLKTALLGAFDKIWHMPSLYGVTLGLLLRWTGTQAPSLVMRPVEMLSDAALPLMILVLGMQLEKVAQLHRPKLVAWAVAISLIAAPLVAIGLSAAFGVTGPARQAVVTLSSMPVAVITTILALEFDLNVEFVTSAVFVSTLASPLTLAPLIAYLSQ